MKALSALYLWVSVKFTSNKNSPWSFCWWFMIVFMWRCHSGRCKLGSRMCHWLCASVCVCVCIRVWYYMYVLVVQWMQVWIKMLRAGKEWLIQNHLCFSKPRNVIEAWFMCVLLKRGRVKVQTIWFSFFFAFENMKKFTFKKTALHSRVAVSVRVGYCTCWCMCRKPLHKCWYEERN